MDDERATNSVALLFWGGIRFAMSNKYNVVIGFDSKQRRRK